MRRLALVSGVALTALGILIGTFSQPAGSLQVHFSADEASELRLIIIVVVVLGAVMQIYGAWPRRRHRHFE